MSRWKRRSVIIFGKITDIWRGRGLKKSLPNPTPNSLPDGLQMLTHWKVSSTRVQEVKVHNSTVPVPKANYIHDKKYLNAIQTYIDCYFREDAVLG